MTIYAIIISTLTILLGLSWISYQIHRSHQRLVKETQELKTRLNWSRKRELTTLKLERKVKS